ncbi:MAG: hypothetical protein HYY85_09025 [Deltaproteobacteria bacterium]|nr:hypothetical protein [Deltaproteobacteria bacterium]
MRLWLKAMPLVALLLTAAWLGGPAWGAQRLTRADRALIAQNQTIDTASAEASRMAGRLADEWRGTPFRFDATTNPRPLTAQDVETLRAQGLGYGEIDILLTLTANQPNPATAKPLNDVLALRRAGKGWGELARELGYKNLGSALRERPEKRERLEKPERPKKPERAGQIDHRERVERSERPSKPERLDRPERPEKPERVEQIDRPERVERPEKRGRR